jgi:hypothetical protein
VSSHSSHMLKILFLNFKSFPLHDLVLVLSVRLPFSIVHPSAFQCSSHESNFIGCNSDFVFIDHFSLDIKVQIKLQFYKLLF